MQSEITFTDNVEMESNLPVSCSFVAFLFALSVYSCSAASTCPLLLASRAADSDKTGHYIVVLKDGTTHERFEDIRSKVVSMTEDEEVHGSVERVMKAFTVKLSDRALSTVSILLQLLLYPTISWYTKFVLSISPACIY